MPSPEFENSGEMEQNPEREILERISEHSREFDEQTAKDCSHPEVFRQDWEVREWQIGDSTIQAIGVSHIPEMFLEFRKEIEDAIQESDIVVNEFAPEALGFYDETRARHLETIPARFNSRYNLEQLRKAYLKYEDQFGIGVFHHEIELLAAKYGKDMALADLTETLDPEDQFQRTYLFAKAAEDLAQKKAELKKAGLYAGAAALGLTSLGNFTAGLMNNKSMSRRRFLADLGLAAGAVVIASATPKISETPPREAAKKEIASDHNEFELIEMLRDPMLADSLQKLAASGHKKIVFIYGKAHLKAVEDCLNDPQETQRVLSKHKEFIKRKNPDPFRIYQLSPGQNHSERFTASEEMIWRRIQ